MKWPWGDTRRGGPPAPGDAEPEWWLKETLRLLAETQRSIEVDMAKKEKREIPDVGYRAWRLERSTDGTPVLRSTAKDTVWAQTEMTADVAPAKDNQSGLYCLPSMELLHRMGHAGHQVLGKVALSGKVVWHDNDVLRAEHMQILALRYQGPAEFTWQSLDGKGVASPEFGFKPEDTAAFFQTIVLANTPTTARLVPGKYRLGAKRDGSTIMLRSVFPMTPDAVYAEMGDDEVATFPEPPWALHAGEGELFCAPAEDALLRWVVRHQRTREQIEQELCAYYEVPSLDAVDGPAPEPVERVEAS